MVTHFVAMGSDGPLVLTENAPQEFAAAGIEVYQVPDALWQKYLDASDAHAAAWRNITSCETLPVPRTIGYCATVPDSGYEAVPFDTTGLPPRETLNDNDLWNLYGERR